MNHAALIGVAQNAGQKRGIFPMVKSQDIFDC